MSRSDILLNSDNTPLITDGDFTTGYSKDQHVAMLLEAMPGEFKEFPLIGVGMKRYINKTTTSGAQLKRDISVGLEADGYKVSAYSFVDNDLKLEYELK